MSKAATKRAWFVIKNLSAFFGLLQLVACKELPRVIRISMGTCYPKLSSVMTDAGKNCDSSWFLSKKTDINSPLKSVSKVLSNRTRKISFKFTC